MCEEAVYDVVALGELLIDFTPVSTDGAGCPTLKANPGGAPGNLLAALSRYGRRHRLSGQGGRGCLRPPPSGVPAPGWSPDPGHPPHLLRLHHPGLCHPGCRGGPLLQLCTQAGGGPPSSGGRRWTAPSSSAVVSSTSAPSASLTSPPDPPPGPRWPTPGSWAGPSPLIPTCVSPSGPPPRRPGPRSCGACVRQDVVKPQR